MRCNDSFEAFHENILLKKTRETRIDDGYSALQDFVRNDARQDDEDEPGIADLLIEMFMQGSYAMKTAIRPKREKDEFDVDVVLKLTLKDPNGNLPDSKATLDWLARRLRRNGFYKRRTEVKRRCVRINYAGEFHLDVAPVSPTTQDGSTLMIPDKTGGWSETDPKGFMHWCDEKDAESDRRLKRVVKFLKWWRTAVDGRDIKVASVVLTTLLGNHSAVGDCDAEALVGTMENLNDWLGQSSKRPQVLHPTLDIDLAERWTEKEFKEFKAAFSQATGTAREALDEPDRDKSIDLWQELFGDAFPRLEDDGEGGYEEPASPGKKRTRTFA